MDILSHGLWAVAVGKGAQVQSSDKPNKLNAWWVFIWGIMPDFFAFAPIFIIRTISWIFGGAFFSQPPNVYEPWTPGFDTFSNTTQYLYQISHLLIVCLIVLFAIGFFRKKIPWVMLGWPLHILADIPSHSYIFYPTPAFWPIASWKLDGFQWGVGHFTQYNYLALALVFLAIYAMNKRNSKQA